jgi:hypothetical protein
MSSFSRRAFLALAPAGLSTLAWARNALAGPPPASSRPVPMLHLTDLFRPHADPDDHWDLACVYALAYRGDADILGVLTDYPREDWHVDPDVLAVAQMNYLTGKAVPVMVGSPRSIPPTETAKADSVAALRGVRALLDLLRRSPRPVVISVLGSCRDIAIAGRLEPDLFAKKCAALYLNAGTGTLDPAKATQLEYNVRLDPASYAAIFDLPCPIYWMPCFEEMHPGAHQTAEYGTFYRFSQGDVLPQLSQSMQRFFAYVFKHGRLEKDRQPPDAIRPDWLQYLTGASDAALMTRVEALKRNMWCTGGFLHAAGLGVTREGAMVAQAAARDPVFTFDPIRVTCTAEGHTTWRADPTSRQRFIFHVRDAARYPAAMTVALTSLLKALP